jgi:hypothetical protein
VNRNVFRRHARCPEQQRRCAEYRLARSTRVRRVNRPLQSAALGQRPRRAVSAGSVSAHGDFSDRTDVNSEYRDRGGWRLIVMAARAEDTAAISRLIDVSADPNWRQGDPQSPLLAAVARGRAKSARLLSEHDASVGPRISWIAGKPPSCGHRALLGNGIPLWSGSTPAVLSSLRTLTWISRGAGVKI